ncbi:MAG: acyl-CoA dehydrogenase family protein [Gammaproteobacteria bacterium]
MPTPVNFGFGEEEQMLRDGARRFFAEHLPADRLHRLVAADHEPMRTPACHWDPAIWQQMAALGWTAIAVPERAGGAGMPAVAALALAEEAGRAAFPGPLVPTLQASHLLAACGTPEADAALARIAAGEAATLALSDARGDWRGGTPGSEWRNGRLHGTAPWVQDARKAAFFVVKARAPSGLALLLVESGAEGLGILPDAIVDLTRDQARLRFDGAEVSAVLAEGDAARAALAASEAALYALVAADLCGAAEWLLQTTAEYARVRKQFDRQIGFFQAIKHPLVDVMMQIDQARSLGYEAAAAIDHEPSQALRLAHMAKAAAAEAAGFGAGRAVQFHGGIGFTWECQVHLWFKRQLHNQMLYGDAVWHRARLADLVLGPVGA